MDKASVAYFREKFKDQPIVIICDNEHNFFDNCSDMVPPIWDDASERVMYIQNNQDGGRMRTEMPLTVSITNYDHIQIIKALVTKEEAVKFMVENKSKLSEDKFKYGMKMISGSARAHRPDPNSKNYWEDNKYQHLT